MRYIILLLIIACVAIQYPLRFGENGYGRIGELEQQIRDIKDHNQALDVRNHAMEAEIADLKEDGSEAMEEKARRELNKVKENETLVWVQYPVADGVSASSGRRAADSAGQPTGNAAKPGSQPQSPAQQAKPQQPAKPRQQANQTAPKPTAKSAQQKPAHN